MSGKTEKELYYEKVDEAAEKVRTLILTIGEKLWPIVGKMINEGEDEELTKDDKEEIASVVEAALESINKKETDSED